MSPELGRFLLVIGVVLVVVGGLAALGVRLPFGRLPGDIAITGDRGGAGQHARPLAGADRALQPLPAPLTATRARR